MNGCYYNEKTADEMFGDTDYNKQTNFKQSNELIYIEYRANIQDYIKFNIKSKYIYINGSVSVQELQAINKKVQELGWIHEREEKENE